MKFKRFDATAPEVHSQIWQGKFCDRKMRKKQEFIKSSVSEVLS
jgi:hypothetical protein